MFGVDLKEVDPNSTSLHSLNPKYHDISGPTLQYRLPSFVVDLLQRNVSL